MRLRHMRAKAGVLLGVLLLSLTATAQATLTRNTRFGKNGLASKDIANTEDTAAAVLVDSNSNVVVVGNSQTAPGTMHVSLVRYTAKTGQVDASFTAAQNPTSFSTSERAAEAVWQNDRILVAGSVLVNGCWQLAVARFTATGTLDTSFGTSGWVHLDIGAEKLGTSGNTYAYDLAYDASHDRIVVVGNVEKAGADYDFAVLFLDGNGGRLDAAGKTDIIVRDFDGQDDRARGVAINAGLVYVAGTAKTGATLSNNFAVICLDEATRQLQSSFGTGGATTFDIGTLAAGTTNSNDTCNDIVFDGSSLRLVGRTDAFDAAYGDDVAVLTVGPNGAAAGQPAVYHLAGDDDARRAVYDTNEGLIVVGSSQNGLLLVDNGTPITDDVQTSDFEQGLAAALQADHSKLVVALDAGLGTNPTRDLTAARYFVGTPPPDSATITIVESAICPNAVDFAFKNTKASDSSQTSFNLGLTQTSTTYTLTEDDYSIVQTQLTGWSLQSVQTVDGDKDAITNGSKIYLCRGDAVTVTFSNKDITPPAVTTKNATASLDASGSASIQPADVFNYGTDACGVTPTAVTPSTFTCTDIGAKTVTLTVADSAGNTNTATATVTVADSMPPVIVGKNITRDLDASGTVSITPAEVFDAAPSSDNCGQVNPVSVDPSSFTCANIGNNSVTLTANDGHGNTATTSVVVTVRDVSAPVVTCKPLDVSLDDTGHATIVADDVINSLADNCAIASKTLSQSAFDCSNVGSNQITVSVKDAAGNEGTCVATVQVKDERAPQLTACPTDISVNTDAGQATAIVTWTAPTASDNCTAPVTSTHQPGEAFPVGTTSVTYSADDSHNPPATCSFNVTVTDGESPTWTGCPQNITQAADPGLCTATVTWTEPTAQDNLGVTNVNRSHLPGSAFPLGTTTVTYTATDAQNNSAACTFTVTVTDSEKPAFTACPANRTIAADTGCTASLTDLTGEAQATDNCGGTPVITQLPTAGTTLNLGTSPVVITATDAAGNQETCTVQITVEDQTKPQITTCPLSRTLSANNACQVAVPDLTAELQATDNCDAAPAKSQTPAAGTLIGLGDTVVTLKVTDAAGNEQTCSATLTVADTTPPTIVAQPPDRTLSFDDSCAAALPDLTSELQVTDNCDPAPQIVQTPAPGSPLVAGDNDVTLTITDAAGKTNSCTVKITVADATAPTLTCPAAPAPISANGDCQAAIPDLVAAAVSADNCPGVQVTQSPSIGRLVGPGDHTVTLIATDATGLISTCDVTVSVVDTTPPDIACPAVPPTIAVNEHGQAAIPDLTAAATIADACPNATAVQDPAAGTMVGLGSHEVTLMATDGAGQTATCKVTVQVVDQTPPSIICPAELTITNNGNLDPTSLTAPTVTDNADAHPTVTPAISNEQPGECPVLKIVTVTWTAKDQAGNTASCTQIVQLADVDTDRDGTVDCQDQCPDDALKTEPGTCGCGHEEVDGCGTDSGHETPDDSGQQTPDENGEQTPASVLDLVRDLCGAMNALTLGLMCFGMLTLKSRYGYRSRG